MYSTNKVYYAIHITGEGWGRKKEEKINVILFSYIESGSYFLDVSH